MAFLLSLIGGHNLGAAFPGPWTTLNILLVQAKELMTTYDHEHDLQCSGSYSGTSWKNVATSAIAAHVFDSTCNVFPACT